MNFSCAENRVLHGIAMGLIIIIFLSGCSGEITTEKKLEAQAQKEKADENIMDRNVSDFNLEELQPENLGDVSEIVADPKAYCLEKESALEQDTCLISIGKSNKDGSVCAELKVKSPDSCYAAIAKANKQGRFCSKIVNKITRNACYKDVAELTLDYSLCEYIEIEPDANSEFKDDCFIKIAKDTRNPDACEGIPHTFSRDLCYYDLAVLVKNSVICSEISGSIMVGEYMRDRCYSSFTETIEGCANILDVYERSDCYYNYGKINDDGEACMLADFDQNKVNCLMDVATDTKDGNWCVRAEDINADFTQYCLEDLAEDSPGFFTCNNIEDRNVSARCFFEFAVQDKNSFGCSHIIGYPITKNQCYREVGILTGDYQLCAKIAPNDVNNYDWCYLAIAKSKNEFELCENLKRGVNYVDCFASIGVEEGDVTICSKMKKTLIQSLNYTPEMNCYKEFARKTAEPEYCSYISSEGLKFDCYEQIALDYEETGYCSYIDDVNAQDDCVEAVDALS